MPTLAEDFLLEAMSPTAKHDPYPLYASMRDKAPVLELGPGLFFAFTHDVVTHVLRAPGFSSDERNISIYDTLPPDAKTRLDAPVMLFRDPPDHTRLRRLVVRAFTPSVVERLRSQTEQIVADHLDRIESGSTVDVISALAHPVPVRVICDLLGVPVADVAQFQVWSDALARSVDPGFLRGPELQQRIDNASLELDAYLTTLVSQRKADPQDDLISALTVAEDGEILSHQELLEMAGLLLLAGHETTVNLIGNGLVALLQNPDQFELLRESSARILPAIEELLRFDSPAQMTQRIVMTDTELAGVSVRTGDQIIAMLGAANRDPAVFADPDRLDVARDARRHVAFGAGLHHCLGAMLARMEAEVTLTGLMRRFSSLELAGPTPRRDGFTLRGLSSLPVTVR
jgi:pimeloyl-[acyl-carrier protein] synthase